MSRSEPTRVLAEGTLRYRGDRAGGYDVDWLTARVFVIEYDPSGDYGGAWAVVVAREPMYLPNRRVPAPVGSIHRLPANDGGYDLDDTVEPIEELLTLDVDALVPV